MRAGIVGASGYTGAEMLRLLCGHPGFEVTVATANEYRGCRICSLYPALHGFYEGEFEAYDAETVKRKCDVVFLGLPHGESMKVAPELLRQGKKVVDLSADFRFEDPAVYEKWYGLEHESRELLETAAYGLPEINRDAIAETDLVANPGCYATAALLGLYPLAKSGLIEGSVVIDAKSGVSGAGRKPTPQTHFARCDESVSPYAVSGHRHQPEIESVLVGLSGGDACGIVFTPHLVPMSRGILCTMYVPVEGAGVEGIRSLYRKEYEGEAFIRVMDEGVYPETKAVQASNNCHIGVEVTPGGRTAVVMSSIDNLVKGAAGQAVQNMNIMCGLAEDEGLTAPGLFP